MTWAVRWASTGTRGYRAPAWTNSPPRASCSPERTPPRRCAHRPGARCSPVATRTATVWSAWRTTASNTARRPHTPPDLASARLVFRTVRHAARDRLPRPARLRRIRRVQLLLRLRRRPRSGVAHRQRPRRAGQSLPAHGRLLRNPPALPARPVRARRHRRRRGARLVCPTPRQSVATSPISTARSPPPTPPSADCSTPSPRTAWTRAPGWCS